MVVYDETLAQTGSFGVLQAGHIWGPFGPIWTLLNHFKQKLIFRSEAPPPNPTLSIWGKKSFLAVMDGCSEVPKPSYLPLL